MLNSISSSIAYQSQDILRPKAQKSEGAESKNDVKENALSPKATAIAEQIANGTYKIDLKASANALIDELF